MKYLIPSLILLYLLLPIQAEERSDWQRITGTDLWHTTAVPRSYALMDGSRVILFDAAVSPDRMKALGNAQLQYVLLTHHHRDTSRYAAEFIQQGIPVKAPKASKPWLSVEDVRKYWQTTIPLPNSQANYFVHPVGIEGIECRLMDDDVMNLGSYLIQVIGTPGHSRDHVSYRVSKHGESPIIIAGDAICSPGKIWSPFTTDWDHWTDAGLKPAAESIRKIQKLKPRAVLPAHGSIIDQAVDDALEQTARNLEETGFLRSFERYSKQRLGNAPKYDFLVPKEQVASGGEKPWATVSPHLYVTGNTYVLVSDHDKACLMVDPWGKRSVEQFDRLKKEHRLGKLEVVMVSHAHFDHYDGIYELPNPRSAKVWTLDKVAKPLLSPLDLRAPFLDTRAMTIDKQLGDGDRASWQEYSFRFHHFPGQSEFTMAVETTIDGKKCLFSADNFFHQDQFSGSGGWMGLNRSWPSYYAQSARKVLEIKPDWILAEHGGPFVFHEEDFRRRVSWAEESSRAANRLCPTGQHRHDWNPFTTDCVPLVQKVKAGRQISITVRTTNHTGTPAKWIQECEGRGVITTGKWTTPVLQPGESHPKSWTFQVPEKLTRGRYIFSLISHREGESEMADAFFGFDVE